MQKQLNDRLRELRPMVDEYHQIEAMLGKLDADRPAPRTRTRRSSSGAGGGGGRRGRRKGSGTRAAEAFELVKARPGITIPELADAMKIKQNYLYRVMPSLAEDGRVRREGKGWVPSENA